MHAIHKNAHMLSDSESKSGSREQVEIVKGKIQTYLFIFIRLLPTKIASIFMKGLCVFYVYWHAARAKKVSDTKTHEAQRNSQVE